MAKSNTRRKRDRAVRQAKSAHQRQAALRRAVAEEAVRLASEELDRLYDPQTPAADAAGLLAEHFEGRPVLPRLAATLQRKGSSAERLAEIAEALGAGAPSLTALTFGAAAAHAAGDGAHARGLLGEALAMAEDADTRARVIAFFPWCGRTAEAIELLEDLLRDDPDNGLAAGHYGFAIAEASGHAAGSEAAGPCPCGSGQPWRDCCGPRERAALDRFADRSGLHAVRAALTAYLPRSGYAEAVAGYGAEWLSPADGGSWDEGERAGLAALAAELALVMVSAGADGGVPVAGPAAGEDERADGEDAGGQVLTAFAADRAVAPELAARARAWRDHIRYGLWQVAGPDAGPGRWCLDIVTGVERYVEIPPDQAGDLPRWAVLAGGIVPVDGVWRATGTWIQLSPAEADAVTETIKEAATGFIREVAGQQPKRARRRMQRPIPFGSAPPNGVIAAESEPAPPELAKVIGMVTGAMLLRAGAEVYEQRVTPPALTSTDGDPMCLIRARIGVADPDRLAERPARHPDLPRGAAPRDEGWEKRWLDERVPALRGRTPREVAGSDDWMLLEALLRQFEYEADLLAARGEQGPGTAWLRRELGMDEDNAT